MLWICTFQFKWISHWRCRSFYNWRWRCLCFKLLLNNWCKVCLILFSCVRLDYVVVFGLYLLFLLYSDNDFRCNEFWRYRIVFDLFFLLLYYIFFFLLNNTTYRLSNSNFLTYIEILFEIFLLELLYFTLFWIHRLRLNLNLRFRLWNRFELLNFLNCDWCYCFRFDKLFRWLLMMQLLGYWNYLYRLLDRWNWNMLYGLFDTLLWLFNLCWLFNDFRSDGFRLCIDNLRVCPILIENTFNFELSFWLLDHRQLIKI
jgi:hypothetical protein